MNGRNDRDERDALSTSVPLILAHRGARRVAPENTLDAFARAVAMRGDLPPPALDTAQEGIGNAFAVAAKVGGQTGADLVATAKSAFVDAFHIGLYVGAGVALLGAIAVLIWMPARARREDLERQALEYTHEWPAHAPASSDAAATDEASDATVSAAASPPRGRPGPATGEH